MWSLLSMVSLLIVSLQLSGVLGLRFNSLMESVQSVKYVSQLCLCVKYGQVMTCPLSYEYVGKCC